MARPGTVAKIEIPTAADKKVLVWIMGEINDVDARPLTASRIAEGCGLSSEEVNRSLSKQIIQDELHRLAHADFIASLEARLVQNSLVKIATHFKMIFEAEDTNPRERITAGKEYRKILDEFVKERGIEEEYILIPPKKLAMMERAYIASIKAGKKAAKNGGSAVSTGIVPLGITPGQGMGSRDGEGSDAGVSATV